VTAICEHCRIPQPCWCEGKPPKERPVVQVVVEPAIPGWVRPPAPVHGPSSTTPTPSGRAGCQAGVCGRAVPPGMLVCGRCADRLFLDLAGVPGLAHALDAAHAKALRFGASRPRPPASRPASEAQEEAPLPFDPRASVAIAVLFDTLEAWVDRIAAERGIDRPPRELYRPMDAWAVLGAWLCAHVSWLRSSPLGPEAVVKLRAAVRAACSVVDRPPDLAYAGPCRASVVDADGLHVECGADLYARPGEPQVTCRACGAAYPLSEQRQWLLAQVEDMLLPATELARAIDGLGVEVTPTAIRKWKQRGRLAPHGHNVRGHPLYRVGDVLDVVKGVAARGHG